MNPNNSEAFISKAKAFFWISFCIFQICIKFGTFSKQDDPSNFCISEITDTEARAWINVWNVPFERIPRQATWWKGPSTGSIWMKAPLSYRLIIEKVIELKKSLLLTWNVLRLFLNTLTADDKYPRISRDNWMQTIQRHLSQKQKIFS